jgi:hypothetical protein
MTALTGFEPERHPGFEPLLAVRPAAVEPLHVARFAPERHFALGLLAHDFLPNDAVLATGRFAED